MQYLSDRRRSPVSHARQPRDARARRLAGALATLLMTAKLSLLVAFGATLVSCGDGPATFDVPAPVEPTRVWVEAILPRIDGELHQYAESFATRRAIREFVEAEAARPFRARLDGGLRYAMILVDLYEELDDRKFFADSNGLNDRGRAVIAVLEDADRHVLDNRPYHLARIAKLDAELTRLAEERVHWPTIRLEPAEADHLVHWMSDRGLDPNAPETLDVLLRTLAGGPAPAAADAAGDDASDDDTSDDALGFDSPLPRVTEAIEAFYAAYAKKARAVGELELRVADGALRYARDMRHFNLNRLTWRDLRDAGGSTAVILARLDATFRELIAGEPEQIAGVFAALEPRHPQYRRLIDARERYRAIEAAGGWPTVRPFALEPGTRSAQARILRERLTIEGFDAYPKPETLVPVAIATAAARAEQAAADLPTPDAATSDRPAPVAPARPFDPDRVDDLLLDAVRAYQETHQFDVDAKPTRSFWASLNLPVSRRIEQIELNIDRWRETRYEGESDYIFVNLPDFHAEVYRDGEREMRFRTVIGRNNRVCDPKTKKWTYPNATPIQHSTMDHLVINPSWYVPPRLFEESLRPRMGNNPDWLAQNGYEVMQLAGGRTAVRQLPGPDNALGTVKFIFPSDQNTYLHDTPQKHYFERTLRGFSSGCVRVQDPHELARYLIAYDGQDDQVDFDAVVESGRSRVVRMSSELPIYIEYYTVQVDDAGRAHFLADFYRHDARRLAPDPDEFDSCTPRTARRSADDGDGDIGP